MWEVVRHQCGSFIILSNPRQPQRSLHFTRVSLHDSLRKLRSETRAVNTKKESEGIGNSRFQISLEGFLRCRADFQRSDCQQSVRLCSRFVGSATDGSTESSSRVSRLVAVVAGVDVSVFGCSAPPTRRMRPFILPGGTPRGGGGGQYLTCESPNDEVRNLSCWRVLGHRLSLGNQTGNHRVRDDVPCASGNGRLDFSPARPDVPSGTCAAESPRTAAKVVSHIPYP